MQKPELIMHNTGFMTTVLHTNWSIYSAQSVLFPSYLQKQKAVYRIYSVACSTLVLHCKHSQGKR